MIKLPLKTNGKINWHYMGILHYFYIKEHKILKRGVKNA